MMITDNLNHKNFLKKLVPFHNMFWCIKIYQFFFFFPIYFLWSAQLENMLYIGPAGGEENGQDVALININAIAAATNNFSPDNKIGQGGFGPVYQVNIICKKRSFFPICWCRKCSTSRCLGSITRWTEHCGKEDVTEFISRAPRI